MTKCAVIVGHTEKRPGAYSEALKKAEYAWNKDLATRISWLGGPVRIALFFRDGVGVAGAYKQAGEWGAHAAVELHFNASSNSSASGTETLYISELGKKLAEAIQAKMVKALELPDRGAKKPWQGRGEASLTALPVPSVIVEPFFGSNTDDAASAEERKQDLAEAIYSGVCDFFGLEWPAISIPVAKSDPDGPGVA